jgi:D-alanine-D-alanine ligase
MTTRENAPNMRTTPAVTPLDMEDDARLPPSRERPGRVRLAADPEALKALRLVAVAYSHVEREFFPTEEAYQAELEVEERARQVVEAVRALGVKAKGYPGDPYFLTNLLVDKPDLVLNLVDTLRGKDALQTTVPAALELAVIPYTGAGMQGLVIGNDRNLVKQLLLSYQLPTPPYQLLQSPGGRVDPKLGLPLIVKLNASGGSVGIDKFAVKETVEDAQARVAEMIATYRMPVVVERFVDGREITAVVIDDGEKKHVFLGERAFRAKADGKHFFTNVESYDEKGSHRYERVEGPLAARLTDLVGRAFVALKHKDYAKFDIRVEEGTGEPWFTDANPNTAFGPSPDLPLNEVLALYEVGFSEVLESLLSKHAKRILAAREMAA